MVRKYPVVIFCTGTYLLSGILMLLNIYVFKDVQNYAIMFPQLAPGIIGVILSVLVRDGKGNINHVKRFQITKENFKWFVLCIIVSIIIIGFSYLAFSILKNGNITSPTFVINSGYIYILLGTIIGSLGEEIGWRGFMLSQLQLNYSPIISSIILGLVWGFWLPITISKVKIII